MKPWPFEILDVVDGDAVRLRALNLVERQLVVALALEVADVLRPDVVHGELKAAPERQVVGVAEAAHLADVGVARREGEEPGAAAVAERPFERQRAGLAAEVELHRRRGQLIVVGRKPGQIVDGEALPHVPVAVPVAGPVPVGRRGGADLQEDLAGVNLGGPGAVNVGLRRKRRRERYEQKQTENLERSKHGSSRSEAWTGEVARGLKRPQLGGASRVPVRSADGVGENRLLTG